MIAMVCGAQEYIKLSWYDLSPEVEFDDPFTELSSVQLYDLSRIAKYRENTESGDPGIQISKPSEIDSLEQVLQAQNINIDSLLSIRYKITELRRKKAESVNDSLNNTNASISGYLLPLSIVDGEMTEFLLVPWVGACIHTPPPPKNQIIYLKSRNSYEVNSRFAAVTVRGLIQTKDKSSLLYLVDGSDNISSAYSILDANIFEYKEFEDIYDG